MDFEGATIPTSNASLAKTEFTSTRHNLTKSDRALLAAYLGYKKTVQIDMNVKKKTDACLFVSSALWPRGEKDKDGIQEGTENETFDDDGAFDLTWLTANEKMPSIFKWTQNDVKIMFEEAHKFDDEQQVACIRSFMVSLKICIVTPAI